MKRYFLFAVLLSLYSMLFAQDAPKQDPDRQFKIEKALKELKNKKPMVRAGAVVSLGELGVKEYANDIVELLKDEDSYVRCMAAETLGKLGAKEHAKEIAGLLKDGGDNVRCGALDALGKLGAKEYVKDIVELLKDEAWGVRENASWALGELGAKEYAKDIAGLLKDEDGNVRARAVGALGQLRAKEYSKDIAELLKDKDIRVIAKAVRALGDFRAKEYIKDIAAFLKYEDPSIQGEAVLALGKFGAKEYTKDIAAFLKTWYAANAAAEALGELGAKEYAKDIASFLKSPAPEYKVSALWALGKFEAKEYAKDIAGLLKDKDAVVRCYAVLALEKFGAKEYADKIGKLVGDSNALFLLDEAKIYFSKTTVSAEAKRVLKEWGVDVQKLKAENLQAEDRHADKKVNKEENEISAQHMIINVAQLESLWYKQDIDQNGQHDYYVFDYAGFYYAQDTGGMSIALTDIAPANSDPSVITNWKTLSTAANSGTALTAAIPIRGYFVKAIEKDPRGNSYCQETAGNTTLGSDTITASDTKICNSTEYGFCAYPAEYGVTGNKTFIIDQSAMVYEKDTGNGEPIKQWPVPAGVSPTTAGWAIATD